MLSKNPTETVAQRLPTSTAPTQTPRSTPTVITLSGLPGSGKDTAADLLQSMMTLRRVSFSDPVRAVAAAAFDFSEDQLRGRTPAARAWRETPDPYWSAALGRDFTPRDALTTVGTDLFRVHFFDKMWVQSTMRTVERAFGAGESVLITDLRHLGEFIAVRDFVTTTGVQWVPLEVQRHQVENANTHRLRYCTSYIDRDVLPPEEWRDAYLDAVITSHGGAVVTDTHSSVWEHMLFSHKLQQVQNNSDIDCMRTSLSNFVWHVLPRNCK